MSAQSRIPVAEPLLDGREAEYVMECLKTGWISSNGRFIRDFEQAFANYCGVRHAVAVNNGTTALHLALVALGVQPGDEVIVPTLTYIASANAVRYCGATPVFIDNDPQTLNIDSEQLLRHVTPRTRGVIPVHLYGHPVDMDPIVQIARARGLFVLEDAAEAIGASYKGRPVGSLGDLATFSFFGNKIITTGEGGMVTTDDDALAARLRLFRGQGMDPERRYWFPVVGYNYRMTNVAAAIGLAQLERIEQHLQARRDVAAAYHARLASMANRIVLPRTEPWARHAWWMYTVQLRDEQCDERARARRDALMASLDLEGIETRPVFYPMHVLPPYRDETGAWPVADSVAARGLNLPTYAALTERQIDRIAGTLERVLA